MNRRTFIKSVGAAAVAIPAIPAIAKSEPIRHWENIPTWINFTEQMPKSGQRVALFTRFRNNKSQNISLGEVIDRSMAKRYYNYPENLVAIEIGLSYSPNRELLYGNNDLIIHCSMNPREYWRTYGAQPKKTYWAIHIQAAVEKATWIKDKTVRYEYSRCVAPRHGEKVCEYVGRDVAYWFPITEDIPEHLPALPEPRPVLTQRSSVTINGVKDTFVTLFKE